MTPILTVEAVRDLMKRTLAADKDAAGVLIVEGLMHNFAFNPEAVAQAKPEIVTLLAELPDNFHVGKGDGWTFLNACMDRHDNHWGEHPDMEALFCVGIAAGVARWVMRDMAHMLPGGMPYVAVDLTEKESRDEAQGC